METDLIEALIRKQKELNLSDRAFARRLNISQPLWTNARNRRPNTPGPKLLRATIREFPSLGDLILKQMTVAA